MFMRPCIQKVHSTSVNAYVYSYGSACRYMYVLSGMQVVLSAVEKSGKLDASAQPAEFFFNLLRTLLYLIALGSKEVPGGRGRHTHLIHSNIIASHSRIVEKGDSARVIAQYRLCRLEWASKYIISFAPHHCPLACQVVAQAREGVESIGEMLGWSVGCWFTGWLL